MDSYTAVSYHAHAAANSIGDFQWFAWFDLAIGILILVLAFFTTSLCTKPKKGNRWFDPAWLAWLAAAVYFIHSVEQYGVSFTGQFDGFPSVMNKLLGFDLGGSYATYNICLVWLAAPVGALLAKTDKAIGPAMVLLELEIAVMQIIGSLIFMTYIPGLVTSIVLVIPLAIWTIIALFGKKILTWKVFWQLLLVDVIYIAILGISVGLSRIEVYGGFLQTCLIIIDLFILVYYWLFVANCFNPPILGQSLRKSASGSANTK